MRFSWSSGALTLHGTVLAMLQPHRISTLALVLALAGLTSCFSPATAADPGEAPRSVAASAPIGVPLAGVPDGPADDPDSTAAPPNLLAMLVESGALTQAQYDALIKDPRFAAFAGESAQGYRIPAAADEKSATPKVILDDSGLSIRSADGETRIDIGGRVQADFTGHSRNGQAGEDITDGTELRRARLEMKGTMRNGWMWAAEADFADNSTALKDFWMGVTNDDGSRVMIGHQKQPYSLAVEMSSNDIPFTERGIDIALLEPFLDRAIGVRVDVPRENSFFAAGLFGESVAANKDGDEGWGAASRFVHTPIREEGEVLHLGVRGAFRVPMSSTKSVRIKDETTHMSNFNVVDTGDIMRVDNTRILGAEIAYANGPWAIIGEANAMEIERDGMDDLSFESWSVETTWSLTGESRADSYRMSAGEFKRLKPKTTAQGLDVTSGGAWELAARVANLDLNDGSISGGEENVLTVGVNWYPTTFARFLLGWNNVLNTRGGTLATADADGLDAVTLRGQLTF